MVALKSVLGEELQVVPSYLGLAAESPSQARKVCKICGQKGVRVLPVTMATHVDSELWDLLGDGFWFSMTPECPVTYFNNENEVYFHKSEIKTRFGRKEKEAPRPICYCLQVTEEQIMDEILEKGCCYSLKDIEAYTKAGTGRWCLTTNPSGKCCREYLPSVVDEYLAQVGSEPVAADLERVREDLRGEGPSARITLGVEGMTCESCSISVATMLRNIGARDVSVSLEEERAEATVLTTVHPDEMAKAIEDIGYRAKIINATRIT